MATEYVGEFEEKYYVILVDGYKVPNIKARKTAENGWDIILDGRFSIVVSGEEIQNWMWWVANAMAISAGYTCFGENAAISNPYKTQVIGLSIDEFKEILET